MSILRKSVQRRRAPNALPLGASVRYVRFVGKVLRRGASGAVGEDIAARVLSELGCELVARNVRADGGEIDLIIRDGRINVAVEVKTSTDGSDPVEAVDDFKMNILARTAAGLDIPIGRFDIVGVTLGSDGAVVRWLRGVDGSDPLAQGWNP